MSENSKQRKTYNTIEVSAPAKIILFGEHAVVYGQPAIAVPVSDLRASATITPNKKFSIIAYDANNCIIELEDDNALAEAAHITLKHLNIKQLPPVQISVQSQIPIASGLGSGAAISCVVIKALSQYLNRSLSLDEINKLVYEIEKIHHGTPSGIDNTVVVYEQAVYFVREQPIQRIENSTEIKLLIANTGKTALTKVAVGDVRKLFEAEPERIQPIIADIGSIVQQARQAMQSGDVVRLGQLMQENHTLLQQLTVSSQELDNLVAAAMQSGALGAKLSGGGRGGNMIALVTDETNSVVAQSLVAAGATQVYETTVSKG